MKNNLSNYFIKYLNSKNINKFYLIEILKTKNPEFGDYTTNIALKISKILSLNSIDIANEIKDFLLKNFKNDFDEITVTNPGFVNMFLSSKLLVGLALKFKDKKYKPDFSSIKKLNINYEYISANPTGDLHIGHARNAIVGDVITRILEYIGHKVSREYYINDGGNQITILAESIYFYLTDLLKIEKKITKEEVGYHGKEIISFANKLFKDGFKLIGENEREKIDSLKDISCSFFLNEIKELLIKMNIKPFEIWTSEKKLLDSGEVNKIISDLKKSGDTFEKDGALWLKTSQNGDDKDRVLIKSDGSLTYMVPDIVNHINKIKRGHNLLIDLWGKDHHGYELRIKSALKSLSYDVKFEIDYINMVQIISENEIVKMSKRAGTSLRIKDILKEIKLDVLKYFLISKNKNQEMEINVSIAEQENLSNPFFYSQYVNARINQIINKYESEIGKIKFIESYNKLGMQVQEHNLLIKILEFEDQIYLIDKEREPSLLINYLKELSQNFNTFYNSCKVISEDIELSNERINLIISLKNLYILIYNLLGIQPINKI